MLKRISPITNGDKNAEIIFTEYYRRVYEKAYNGTFLFFDDQQKYDSLIKFMCRLVAMPPDSELHLYRQIAHQFKFVSFKIFREMPLIWLHEAGYKIKIWGTFWDRHNILSPYAMGQAPNGEVLAKIINASKIVLGVNLSGTSHPRIFEVSLCESMYLSFDIDPRYNLSDAKALFKENEELVFFSSKEDLLHKVEYYLSNPDERTKVARRAKQKILDQLTYEKILGKIFYNEIPTRLYSVKV